MEFRFKTLGVQSSQEKLDILLSKLSSKHIEIWQAMEENLQSDYQEVLRQLKRVFGRKSYPSRREFWFSKQGKAETSLEFAKKIWGIHTQIEGITAQDAIEVIRIGCHYKVADKLQSKYSNVDELMDDIENIQSDLRLREEVWSKSRTHDNYSDRQKVMTFGAKTDNETRNVVNTAFESFKDLCIRKYGISASEFQLRMDKGVCVKCGISKEHSAKDCPKAPRSKQTRNASVDEIKESNEELEILQEAIARAQVDEVKFDEDSPIIKGFINGYIAQIKVDTGAGISLVNSNFVPVENIRPTKWNPIAANGTKISTLGESVVKISVSGRSFEVLALVMQGMKDKDFLLSYQDFLKIGGKISIDECSKEDQFATHHPELREFISQCISTHYRNNPITKSRLEPVKIELKEGSSEEQIQGRAFKPSKEQKSILDKKIQVLIEQNILREKEGATTSPAFLVSKANGKDFRLLCDFRKFNEHTKSVATTITTIEDLQDKARGNRVFTVIDLTDGFFQVELEESTKQLTGISTQEGRYEFNVLPQGAKQSPPCFHNRIKRILNPLKHAFNYIDDIVLMSPTIEEAKQDFISLLKILTKYNLKVKWSKAKVFMKEVEFLGSLISNDGKRAGIKAEKLKQLSPPKTKGQLRKLLAKFGAFRQFVVGFAIKVAPLSLLLRKERRFYWKPEFNKILEKIIQEILTNKLWFPKEGEELLIHCDAAKRGIGATLRTSSGKLVKCLSQTLTDPQSRWSTFEKELYAIRQALKAFKPLVGNNKTRVLSDNQAVVKFIKGGGSLDTKPLRIREWVSDLLSLQFDVAWIKGKDNVQADCLSRLSEEVLTRRIENCNEKPYVDELYHVEIFEVKRQRTSKESAKKKIKVLASSNDKQPAEKDRARNVIMPSISESERSTMPPSTLQVRAIGKYEGFESHLKRAHMAHAGVAGMKLNLKEVAYKDKNKLIEQFVKDCIDCKRKQIPRRNYLKGIRPEDIGTTIAMDSIYLNDHNYAFLAVDLLSGFISLSKCDKKYPNNALKCFYGIMSTLGQPKCIIVDNGLEFKGNFSAQLTKMGIEILNIIPYHASSNPAERKVQEFRKLSRIYGEDCIEFIELLLNHQRSTISGYSPAEIVVGRTCIGIMQTGNKEWMSFTVREQIAKEILNAKDKRLEKANKGLRKEEYSNGEEVLIYRGSGEIDYAKIVRKKFHNAYLVISEGKEYEVSADFLIKRSE